MSFDFRVAINQHVFIMQGANTVADIQSIGLIELSSVATGYQVEDVMIKAATVKLLLARSICSGKFLIAISGDVASVTTAIEAGGAAAGASLIDPKDLRSIGVIETFSAASIIDAADAAVKSANVTLLRVHLAMALGGKGFVMMAGDVSSVQAAVEAGSRAAAEEGMLVARGVIPAPSEELFRDYI
jgi:microcompartment protein CcmL/EutN